MKSGMNPSFKMMGSKPYKKALVGDQHELPDHLKQEILNSPAKQKIVGEDTSEIKKDAKGKDYSLALYDTESGVMKGDTIRPGNAPRVGDYIMGGDYDLKKKGEKNYEIEAPVKQKEVAKVAGKAALEGAKKLAPKAVESQIKKMLGGGATDSEIRKYVKSTGTGDKYEYNWDNVTQRVESHPLQMKGSKPYTKKKKYDVETADNIETAGGGTSDHITFRNKKGKSVDYQQYTDADGNMTTYKTKYGNKRGKDGSYEKSRKTISNKRGERQIKRKLNKQN